MGWLEDQVAIITGGGSGIGRAVAERYVREGARVVLLDRDPDRLDALEAQLAGRCRTVCGDGGDPEVASRCVALAVESFGGLDALVGNVGLFDWHKRLDRMSAEELGAAFDELFAINVKSHLLIAREAHPHLRASRGSLILTCSTASFAGGGGGALYTASKFAVRGLVHQLACEWAPDVRVNGVAPGGTVTALSGLAALGSRERAVNAEDRLIGAIAAATPLGFVAAPEDHAALYVLLASRESSRGMTGSIVVSDGGLLSRL